MVTQIRKWWLYRDQALGLHIVKAAVYKKRECEKTKRERVEREW